jgi:prevent-host-death family protein
LEITVPITTLSSREFNQDASKVKRAARSGPVFITDRGKPALVVLSIEEYQKLTASKSNMADLLSFPGAAEIEFNPPRSRELARPAELE